MPASIKSQDLAVTNFVSSDHSSCLQRFGSVALLCFVLSLMFRVAALLWGEHPGGPGATALHTVVLLPRGLQG